MDFNLATILPELILACGAMALLMLGVFLRKEQGELVLGLAILVIIVAGVFVAQGARHRDRLPGQLHRRSLRAA